MRMRRCAMLSIVCVLGCLLGLTATGEPQWESITNVNSAASDNTFYSNAYKRVPNSRI